MVSLSKIGMSNSKIALVGAGGNLGKPVLDKLVASGKFEVTVLARESSSYTSPHSSVKVQKLDLQNHAALVSALQGADAVLLTFGDLANLEANSKPIIDAAIEAGVKRVIPGNFGGDIYNLPGRDQIAFTTKHNVAKYLQEKADSGAIEYTSVANGPFFDWGLTNYQFVGFDIPNRKAAIFDDGNAKFDATTLDSISQAVVGILANPSATKNRQVRIHDFYTTQNEVQAILEELTGAQFTVEKIDSAQVEADALAGLQRGEWTLGNISTLIKVSVWGKNSSGSWGENDDSESLGLQKKDLKEEIKKVL